MSAQPISSSTASGMSGTQDGQRDNTLPIRRHEGSTIAPDPLGQAARLQSAGARSRQAWRQDGYGAASMNAWHGKGATLHGPAAEEGKKHALPLDRDLRDLLRDLRVRLPAGASWSDAYRQQVPGSAGPPPSLSGEEAAQWLVAMAGDSTRGASTWNVPGLPVGDVDRFMALADAFPRFERRVLLGRLLPVAAHYGHRDIERVIVAQGIDGIVPTALNRDRPPVDFFSASDVLLPAGQPWRAAWHKTGGGGGRKPYVGPPRLPLRVAQSWLAVMATNADRHDPGLPVGDAGHFMTLAGQFPAAQRRAILQRLLPVAARHGHTGIVMAIVDAGIDVDHPSRIGRTALGEAVRAGMLDTAKALRHAGADLDSADRYGMSVLYHATRTGRPDVIAWLLAQGADQGLQRPGAVVPFLVALESGDEPAMACFLDHGIDLAFPDRPDLAIGDRDAVIKTALANGVSAGLVQQMRASGAIDDVPTGRTGSYPFDPEPTHLESDIPIPDHLHVTWIGGDDIGRASIEEINRRLELHPNDRLFICATHPKVVETAIALYGSHELKQACGLLLMRDLDSTPRDRAPGRPVGMPSEKRESRVTIYSPYADLLDDAGFWQGIGVSPSEAKAAVAVHAHGSSRIPQVSKDIVHGAFVIRHGGWPTDLDAKVEQAHVKGAAPRFGVVIPLMQMPDGTRMLGNVPRNFAGAPGNRILGEWMRQLIADLGDPSLLHNLREMKSLQRYGAKPLPMEYYWNDSLYDKLDLKGRGAPHPEGLYGHREGIAGIKRADWGQVRRVDGAAVNANMIPPIYSLTDITSGSSAFARAFRAQAGDAFGKGAQAYPDNVPLPAELAIGDLIQVEEETTFDANWMGPAKNRRTYEI